MIFAVICLGEVHYQSANKVPSGVLKRPFLKPDERGERNLSEDFCKLVK